MKLRSIKISNILSFEEKKDINDSEPIVLNDVNILIGPNGAGKSNFLEILNQLFRTILIKPYALQASDYQSFKGGSSSSSNDVITPHRGITTQHLKRNNKSQSKRQVIEVTIALNDNDKENLKFIFDNLEKLNNYLETYSRVKLKLSEGLKWESIEKAFQNNIILFFQREDQTKDFVNTTSTEDPSKAFIIQYLVFFDCLNKVIAIQNLEEQPPLPKLKETFSLIGCYRNYSSIALNYSTRKPPLESHTEIDTKQKQENTTNANADTPTVFQMMFDRLSRKHYQNHRLDYDAKLKILESDPSYKLINEELKKLLAVELRVQPPNTDEDVREHRYQFSFVDLNSKSSDGLLIEELSAGQKSIIHFIFNVFGHDIKDGIIVIDEPELHLHPQIQKQYLQIIQNANQKRGVQFVVVTHSPVFTDPNVISSIHRFYKDQTGFTQIAYNPNIGTDTEMKELVRILTHTNASKIFFADKVVLVEGETDEYFYRCLLDRHLKEQKYVREKNQSIEIVSITGKNQKETWLKFLRSFKIKTYYIGDWDNAIEYNLIEQSKIDSLRLSLLNEVLSKITDNLKHKGSLDARELIRYLESYLTTKQQTDFDELKNLFAYLKKRHTPFGEVVKHYKLSAPGEFAKTTNSIEEKYTQGIFILKKGELEDYLSSSKNLSSVIELCEEQNFDKWYKTDSDTQTELKKIFDQILI